MIYTILLENMEFRAMHGCYDMERRVGNRFRVDVEIDTELGDIALSDDVTRAVSYLDAYGVVRREMAVTSCTLECVAQRIVRALHESFPAIAEVRVKVAKLAPPLGGKVGAAGVFMRG